MAQTAWILLRHDGNRGCGKKHAMQHFKQAGKLGLGEGYGRLAAIHCGAQNWTTKAMMYYPKAADRHCVVGIHAVACQAHYGYIDERQPEEQKLDPDFEEAFRWFLAGAQLGQSDCCAALAWYYLCGQGVQKNFAKGFKWSKRAAEQGHPTRGMYHCGECYRLGEGVEQSNEQAIYWYEKSLEKEDNEAFRKSASTPASACSNFRVSNGYTTNLHQSTRWKEHPRKEQSVHGKKVYIASYGIFGHCYEEMKTVHLFFGGTKLFSTMSSVVE
jgi:TPR repeat protein